MRNVARALALPLLVSGVAFLAPDLAEAACAQNYTSDVLVNDLTTLQLALRNLDETSFNTAGARLESGLSCVASPVPPMVFASAFRYIGTYRYLQNDQAGARKWFRSALELDPTYNWDAQELDLDSPMRAVFDEERNNAHVETRKVEGKVLAQPAGSTFSIDGRPLVVAAATADRPHVIQQVASADRSVRGTWVIEGNAFPAQMLADAAMAGPTPDEAAAADKQASKQKKEKAGKKAEAVASTGSDVEYTDSGAVKVERMRPPEKTPLMIVGAVALAGAGGLYAATFATKAEFDSATTTADLLQAQTLTNALVLASGGVALAGLGIGYWGVVLDGGAGVGITGHF